MEKFNSWKGHLVKGRVLKSLGLTWVKVTNEKMMHNEYQYKIGENEDVHDLLMNDCSRGGLYFCPLDVIGKWMSLGNGYHEVTFSDVERVWVEENKCKAKRIVLGEKVLFINMPIEICKIAAAENGCYIEYMSDERRNDPEICKIAAQSNGNSIQYMNEERKNNPEICKIAAQSSGDSIRFMSNEHKNDPEICKLAARSSGDSIRFMSNEHKNDPEICKLAARSSGDSIRFMSYERMNDPEICKIAVRSNVCSIYYMNDERRDDPEIREIVAANLG
jgi:hypothetical protein